MFRKEFKVFMAGIYMEVMLRENVLIYEAFIMCGFSVKVEEENCKVNMYLLLYHLSFVLK